MPARVILEVRSSLFAEEEFPFDAHDTFVFGRHSECHIRLRNDPLVSRHHFILEANPPDARIRDLGSLNGTVVNGVKYGGRRPEETPEAAETKNYPSVDLKDGDRITVGDTRIDVRIDLPLVCRQCESEIPEAELAAAEWMAGSFMCAACRRGFVAQCRPATPVNVLRCDCCGKDVSGESQHRRCGKYICRECRTDLMGDADGMRRLVQEAARRCRRQTRLAIEGYRIGKEVGRGGMGLVYAGSRVSDGKRVAIKVMLSRIAVDQSACERFRREMELLARLRHRNVVSFFEGGIAGSVLYFVTEWCNGPNLDQFVRGQGGRVPVRIAGAIMLECLEGLSHAHEMNVVHRDLKPHNVLLHQSKAKWVAKLSDFGLAKSLETAGLSGMTATGAYGGTCQFMPREQLTDFRKCRPTSDVWSMAATFYCMLTGHCPLEFPPDRDPIEVLLNESAVPIRQRNSHISKPVAGVLDRALSCDPAERYQTAGQMKRALQKSLE